MKQDSFDNREIWQVSDLTRSLKYTVQKTYESIWVEGEISNLARPASGHLYFTIKDSTAQIRCVLFRSVSARSRFNPDQGELVLVRASASVYEARGDLQLICEHIEPAGDGLLQRRFEEIKKKLSQEGLFDDSHKSPLPQYPSTIAVISSASSAAFQDFRNVMRRRYPIAQLILYDVLVQGKQAAHQIQNALEDIQRKNNADVIALIRGGGSIEDLWAFNDEALAHKIYHLDIPVITGIGHEIDFTIADFVSDVRAPTPSAAAEILSPDQNALAQKLKHQFSQLRRIMNDRLRSSIQTVDWNQRQLKRLHPTAQLTHYRSTLDRQAKRLAQLSQDKIDQSLNKYRLLHTRLQSLSPAAQLHYQKSTLNSMIMRLKRVIEQDMEDHRNRVHLAATTLHTVSPLQTLQRGYAIALSAKDGKIIRSYKQINPGSAVKIALHQGHVDAEVKESSAAPLISANTESKNRRA